MLMFLCFVALRPISTAMVMAGRQYTNPHFFLGKLEQAVNQYFLCAGWSYQYLTKSNAYSC